MQPVDVLIMGGGLAGTLLARQLRLALPSLSIALVEPDPGPRRKVGESTVELGADYLNRRLGLSPMLYREHLPKQGLRFYFDSVNRDLPLHQQSEIGMSSFAFRPSFQVDRGRLEAALLAGLQADGVGLWRGWRVKDITLGQPNDVTIGRGTDRHSLKARWLVDASGRRGLLARALKLWKPVPEHALSAAWCRVEGIGDIEACGDGAWRARWRHSTRDLATNHFCQDRAWTWVIPLREGLTSVGWVGMPDARSPKMATREGLLEALRSSAALADLLKNARAVDIGTGQRLAYGTTRYLSPDRWAVVGEAAAFTDPLFSPGTDHIAWQNDLLTDLIRRDVAGEDLGPPIDRANRLLEHLWRITLDVYVGQYDNLASYDLFRLRYVYDVYNYFNSFGAYLRDDHLDPAWIDDKLARAPIAEASHQEIGLLFSQVAGQLRAEGRLWEGNQGGWDEGLFDWSLQRTLDERSPAQELRFQKRLYASTRKRLHRALAHGWERPAKTGWIRDLVGQMRLEQDLRPA